MDCTKGKISSISAWLIPPSCMLDRSATNFKRMSEGNTLKFLFFAFNHTSYLTFSDSLNIRSYAKKKINHTQDLSVSLENQQQETYRLISEKQSDSVAADLHWRLVCQLIRHVTVFNGMQKQYDLIPFCTLKSLIVHVHCAHYRYKDCL